MNASRRRGSGLIEILVALAITGILVAGILQTFSLALLQSQGSSTRTRLTYKCQQVIEVIRLSQYLGKNGTPAFAASYGISYPLVPATNVALPYDAGDASWSSWGPAGANVVEQEDDAYRLYYSVASAAPAGYQIRVTAMPVDSPELPTGLKPAAAQKRRFFGKASTLKKVEYVARVAP